MKRLFTLVVCQIIALALFADPIGRERAAQLASAYMAGGKAPRLVQTARRAPSAANAALYVFSRGEGEGFVIVSGDDCLPPVLGVADSGDYDRDLLPPALTGLIDAWTDIVGEAQANGAPARAPRAAYGTRNIQPLMPAHWGQGDPFNRHAPYVDSGLSHAVTGCVATAGAMLSYFWGDECFDRVQNDTPLYISGKLNVDEEVQIKAGTPYNWSLMQDNYGNFNGTWYDYSDASADAVAVLMATLGMTSRLMYSAGETGGYMSDLCVAIRSQVGLENQYVRKDNYTEEAWAALILENLERGLPVGYAGASDTGGHAFILDGYRMSDDLFHFNFGWNGYGDGYFSTLTSVATAANGYRYGQQMLCNFAPVHPRVSATLDSEGLAVGAEATLTVNLRNDSRIDYKGICLMISADAVDYAAASTTVLRNTTTVIPTGTTAGVDFTYTPTAGKPLNYVVTDNNGLALASGVLAVEGDDPEPTGDFVPYVVTTLDQISEAHVYSLCLNTVQEQRGYLTATSSTLSAGEQKVANKQRFAILRTGRGCYLFNASYSRFVSPVNKTMSTKPKGFFSLRPADVANRWIVVNPLNDNCLQHNDSKVPSIEASAGCDAGNQWLIEAVGLLDEAKLATAKAAIDEYEATLAEGIPVAGLTPANDMLTLMVGQTAALEATVSPVAATDKTVEWTSSDAAVAVVEAGVLTAVGEGVAAITARCGTVEAKCQLVVTSAYNDAPVASLDELDERVLYSFGTNGRGLLSLYRSAMRPGTRNVTGSEQFAVIRTDKGCYLWNVAYSRFVPTAGEDAPEYPDGAYNLVAARTAGRWLVKNKARSTYWMQHSTGGRFVVSNWNTQDVGNQWQITPVGLAPEASLREARERIAAYENATPHKIAFADATPIVTLGTTAKLQATVLPTSVSSPVLTWTVDNTDVLDIDSKGNVTAKALGEAVVTVSCGDAVGVCQVSVQDAFETYTVTTAAQFTDGHIYTFNLGDRGYLTYDEPRMGDGVVDKVTDQQQFLLLKSSRGYYIYNVSGGKFVPAKGNEVLERPNGHFTFTAANTSGKWIVKSNTGNWMQHGGAKQFLVDDGWKTQDAGNQWQITAVGRLAPSALAKARAAVDEYELTVNNTITGLASIKDGVAYMLFAPRGSLVTSADAAGLWGSCVIDGFRRDPADARQQWGLFKLSGHYYLYNLGSGEFVGGEQPGPMTLTKVGTAFMISDSRGRYVNLGTGYAQGAAVNDWFTPDDGNLFTICKSGTTFDYADLRDLLDQLDGVDAPAATTVAAPRGVYDLQGRALPAPTRGLFIVDGRKIVVR